MKSHKKMKMGNPNKQDMDNLFGDMKKMHDTDMELESMAKHMKAQSEHLRKVGSPFKRGR